MIGSATLDLAEGSATFVHAVCSAKDGTLTVVSFTIPGLHSAPGGVPAGTGPADNPVPTIMLVVLLTIGATAGIRMPARTRSATVNTRAPAPGRCGTAGRRNAARAGS